MEGFARAKNICPEKLCSPSYTHLAFVESSSLWRSAELSSEVNKLRQKKNYRAASSSALNIFFPLLFAAVTTKGFFGASFFCLLCLRRRYRREKKESPPMIRHFSEATRGERYREGGGEKKQGPIVVLNRCQTRLQKRKHLPRQKGMGSQYKF